MIRSLFALISMVFTLCSYTSHSQTLLTYAELMRLSKTQRNTYLREVSKSIVALSPRTLAQRQNGLERHPLIGGLQLLFLDKALATEAFRCVGGGIPIPAGDVCGTQSYAGFSCPSGMQICNPFLFGVRPSGEPVCFERATTDRCYNNTRVGTTTVTDPVFDREGAEQDYATFAQQIDQICGSLESGQPSPVQVAEGPRTLRAACRQVRRQSEINRERNLRGFREGEQPEPPDPEVTQEDAAAPTLPEGLGPVLPAESADLAPTDPNNPCRSTRLTERIPNGTHPASQLELPNRSGAGYDSQVANHIRQGNIPDFLRQLVPVEIPSSRQCQGQSGPITICVMPDYLSIGDDRDYVHTPMGLNAAIEVAREFGFILPTTRMVDQIYSQAEIRLSPSTRTPNASMTTTPVFRNHSAEIRRDIGDRQGLVAGHKKDLVLTNRILDHGFRRVAIYGWHRPSGSPIQPLSTVHGQEYADYSHGVRLVSQTAFIDGRGYPIEELLRDPNCAAALSSEGALRNDLLQAFRSPGGAPAPMGSGSTVTD